jgi:hypothetical protein
VLWDHYALILLLPTAWLLARRRWLAAAIPLATATLLLGLTPPMAYPVAYWAALLGVVVEGALERRQASGRVATPATAAAS